MDLSKYPMDTQTCQLQLESCEYMSRRSWFAQGLRSVCSHEGAAHRDLSFLDVEYTRFDPSDCTSRETWRLLKVIHILGKTIVH